MVLWNNSLDLVYAKYLCQFGIKFYKMVQKLSEIVWTFNTKWHYVTLKFANKLYKQDPISEYKHVS